MVRLRNIFTCTFKQFLLLSLFIIAHASVGQAQQQSDSGTKSFCTLTATDLLAVLNGSWTIQQGSGTATGRTSAGAITIPLPPPSPTSVNFKYDSAKGVVEITSADLAEGMVMFPAAEQQQGEATQLLGAKSAGTASACTWSSLPTLIGTNFYSAFGKEFYAMADSLSFCENFRKKMEAKNAGPYYSRPDVKEWYKKHCSDKQLPSPFEMEMTMVLRFSSANHGSGTVYFKGKDEMSTFNSSAPVTFTR